MAHAPAPHGIDPAHLPAIIAALRGPAEPERDIKLKVFESGEPDEWLQWRARFVNIARCKNWDDAQQRRALSQSMAGKAIEATQHIRIEAAGGAAALTAAEALDAYEAKFVTAAGTTRARSEFLSSTQKKGETMPQWHTRISTLYRRAHPGQAVETSHELIERFCLGMWNATITERTLTDHPATMTAALDAASRHIATLVTMERRLDGRSRQERGINAMQAGNQGGSGTGNNSRTTVSSIICHHCRKPGHIRRQCYAYKRQLEQQRSAGGRAATGRGGQRGFSGGRGSGGRPQSGQSNGGAGNGAPPPSLNALAAYLDAALENAGTEKETGMATSPPANAESGNA